VILRFIPLLFVFVLLQGCTQKVSCEDLFSKYADKPTKLKFIKCTKGTGQTQFKATYSVSGSDADEVEKALVKQYKLIKFSDYYHAMPMNEVHIAPKNLLEINPYYSLSIEITRIDYDELTNEIKKIPNGFFVYVKVWEI
jgi:hypothetical protein